MVSGWGRSARSANRRPVLAVAVIAALLFAASPALASGTIRPAAWWRVDTPELVSVTSTGTPGYGDSNPFDLSDDGRFVAIESEAKLSTEDTNTYDDVYIRDLEATTCALGSKTPSVAVRPNAPVYGGSMSDDGQRVAFLTSRDMTPTDTNNAYDIYVKDAGSSAFLRLDAYGDGSSYGPDTPSMSGNGRFVVFSTDDDISADDTNGRRDVYRWDTESDETTLVSAPNAVTVDSGTESRGSRSEAISDDGRYVAFYTGKSFDASDTNDAQDLYVKDMQTGEYTWADISGTGADLGSSGAYDLRMSGNGRYVVFESNIKLSDADRNGTTSDIYRWDRVSGETTLVSAPREGAVEWNRGSRDGVTSDDGRYVAFFTGQDLLASDTNGKQDIYLKDMVTGALRRVIITPDGSSPGSDVYDLVISGDGSTLAYSNSATGRYDQTYVVPLEPALTPGSTRMQGLTRYATAVDVSKNTFPDGAATVVIATGENFPDALCASALAGVVGGPILLTPANALPADVKAELTRLGARNAYIVGGTPSVSAAVENDLRNTLSGHVNRIAGADRYLTSEAVANRVIEIAGGSYDGKAFVATGLKFPDAAAVAPLAAGLDRPILLANPKVAGGAVYVPAETKSVAMLGSTATVPADVETALKTKLGEAAVVRLGGLNRYETAALIADYGVSEGLSWNGVGIANGERFPDALAGGASIGLRRSVVLLTPQATLASAASAALTANASEIGSVTFLGSTDAVSEAVQTQVEEILGF